MYFKITKVSGNTKTGPIPVTTTSRDSCPKGCAFYDNCYANFGRLRMWWDELTKGTAAWALGWTGFISGIRKLPALTIWRHDQAGELPGDGINLDREKVRQLTAANKVGHKKGFTYCHYDPWEGKNAITIYEACRDGLTINVSCEWGYQVDKAMANGLPAVVVLHSDLPRKKVWYTEEGKRVVRCPAEYMDNITCSNCGRGNPLCYRADRDYAVGFYVHGNGKKKANAVVQTVSQWLEWNKE